MNRIAPNPKPDALCYCSAHSSGFPHLTKAGADLRAFVWTVNAVVVVRSGTWYLLATRGPDPVVLFAAEDSAALDWIDFSIELVAGLLALMLGISLGKRGYQALKPVIRDLWHDQGFRDRVELVGRRTQEGSPLAVGVAVNELWAYLWHEHQAALLKGIMAAVGSVIGPRAVLIALLRWLARLVSGGAALAVEVGLLILPLGRKLRRRDVLGCKTHP